MRMRNWGFTAFDQSHLRPLPRAVDLGPPREAQQREMRRHTMARAASEQEVPQLKHRVPQPVGRCKVDQTLKSLENRRLEARIPVRQECLLEIRQRIPVSPHRERDRRTLRPVEVAPTVPARHRPVHRALEQRALSKS